MESLKKLDGSVAIAHTYDIENRLTAVREGGAVLMAATYDGDGNRTFQLTRQMTDVEMKDDSFLGNLLGGSTSPSPTNHASSIPEIFGVSQEEIYTYLEQIFEDPADTIFWYGVIQGMIEFIVGGNTFLTAICTDWFSGEWTLFTDQYREILHSEVICSDTDIETMQNAGLSEEEIAYIATGKTSVREDILIPENSSTITQVSYDLTYYVNDVNTANTQVLMTYGASESQEASYIYGLERIAEIEGNPVDADVNTRSDEGLDNADELSASAEYYIYDGRGSVVQTMTGNEITLSLTYDPFGEITSGVDENFIGYAYNGEETNNVTGLQYLRARYYDAELGSFITIDSYLGSLTDTISQNRYTYANNDPVNNIDPSGHYSQNVNGTAKYYQSTGLNELRDYMTAAALWAGEVTAQSGYNSAVSRANNTAFTNYQNISGISQSTANSYIAQGIAQAEQVSMNYGCSEPAVPNEAVAKFTNNVNAGRVSANAQIEGIKESKKAEYDKYQISSLVQDMKRRIIINKFNNILENFKDIKLPSFGKNKMEPYLIYSVAFEHGNENEYGDMTKTELINMDTITKDDLELTEDEHIARLNSLMKFFSMGDLEDVALDMADAFVKGEGDLEYTNDTLTDAVINHPNTIAYYEAVSDEVVNILEENGGDLNSLYYDESNRNDSLLINAMKKNDDASSIPSYNGIKDYFSGITICTHGWNGNEIYVTSYELDGDEFSGTLHFKFTDTYGLDENDIDEEKLFLAFKLQYGDMEGFKSWYILQHYDAYGEKHKPLNTVVEFDVDFSGTIN